MLPTANSGGDKLSIFRNFLHRNLARKAGPAHSAKAFLDGQPLDDASLRSLIDNLSDAIYFVDLDGVIRYVSPAIASITGLAPTAFIGRHYTEVIVADEVEQASSNLNRATQGEIVRSERRIKGADGSARLTRVAVRPVLYQSEIVGVVGVMTDIEPLRQAESERERLNRELRAVSECNQALVRADNEKTLLDAICRIACEKAGYLLAWVAFCHSDEQRSAYPAAIAGCDEGYIEMARPSWSVGVHGQCVLCRAIRTGSSACVQDILHDESMAQWRDEAQKRGFRSCIALPLIDDRGGVLGALTLYSGQAEAFTPVETRLLEELAGDLSFGLGVLRMREKRRLAEEERERLLREQRAVTDCNQAMARAVNEKSLFADICRIVCEQAGYRMAWVGMPQQDDDLTMLPVAGYGGCEPYLASAKIHWADDAYGRGPTGRAAREGRTVYVQDYATDPSVSPWREAAMQYSVRSAIALPLRSPDGPPHAVLTLYSDQANPFTANELRLLDELAGDIAFGLTSLRDKASKQTAELEQARLRQHLEQAQKMEAVGRLAGGIAHDFNNVLGVILGYSELLLAMPDLPAAVASRITEIQTSGQHAAELTRQLLIFSRKQVLAPRLLDLNDVIRETDRMLRRLIGESIDLRLALADRLPSVRVDPAQMQQVILNFCINARDAMPQGGRLTIETNISEVDAHLAATHPPMLPGRYVRMAVSDNGCGMDAATLSHIFEPFFTTKGPDRGTGLGLATVYGIVQQSGGQVWAYSEPGRGATFSVYLPAQPGDSEALLSTTAPAVAAMPQGSETVLLVEDSSQLRSMTREILQRCGYRVLEAADPESAQKLFDEMGEQIALLVTDVVLPRLSGPALAERLRHKHPSLRLLFVSGYADHAVIHSGLLPPDAPFLQKPYAIADLARKVRATLDAPPPSLPA